MVDIYLQERLAHLYNLSFCELACAHWRAVWVLRNGVRSLALDYNDSNILVQIGHSFLKKTMIDHNCSLFAETVSLP